MDAVTLALAKKYTADTVAGMGAIKGDKGDKGNDGISPTIAVNTSSDSVYTLDISDSTHSFTTPNLKGAKGNTGAQGIRGEKGDRGDDGYPFLIYKQYDSISEFNAEDFPEIGLMFMVMTWLDDNGYPIYRYTGDGNYSLITYMNTTGIKGEKGDKGDKGDTGDKGTDGLNGADGATFIPSIGTVSTLDSDASATVSVNLDNVNQLAVFNFGIPRGQDGTDGEDGQDGQNADMSRVSALENSVAELEAFTSGTAKRINAYCTGGAVEWQKYGRMVLVQLRAITLATWSDGDKVLTEATLPKPTRHTYGSINSLNGTEAQLFAVTVNGALQANGGVSHVGEYYGQFWYISAS